MEKSEIIAKLSKQIATEILNLPEKVIVPNEPLISSGLVDSFSLVDLSMLVEDSFDVRIDDSELNADTFDTLNQLTDIILSRM